MALFMGFSGVLCAQNKLSGTVTDDKNLPLPGVSIYAPELQKGTLSDTHGHYLLNGLRSGNLKLVISNLGFETLEQNIAIQKDSTLNIMMQQRVHVMDEVIISTAFSKLQSQNVMKVEHAAIRALQQQGVSTLAEGLATIPGVSQIATGTSIGKPVIRGLSGSRVLVYSQGVRLENQQFGDEHGLGLNDSGIESVEVIKGPASLLYGSDALGGVLYFNPEKFADANALKADFRQQLFSNTLGSNTSLGVKTSFENWKLLLRADYAAHADYKIPSGGRVTNTRYNETDVKAGIGYNNSAFSTVFRYNLNQLQLGIPENGIIRQTRSKTPDYPRQKVVNQIYSLHNSYFFTSSKLTADIGYIANDRSEFEDSRAASLQMDLTTLNYDIKYHFPQLGKFEAIAGIQGMTQANKNSGLEYLIPDATTNDFGIFGTSNYSWGTNVVQAGIRYDNRKISTDAHGIAGQESFFSRVDRSFDSFNASIGYKTDLAKQLLLRLNLASGFRAPNLSELTSNGVHEGTNRYEIGNVGLTTEQNFQADVNVEFKNEHFEFFINGFYNHVNNYIYTAPAGEIISGNEVYNYIQNDAALFGGEAGIHFHPHPYDWLHFESSFESVTGKRSDGHYLPLIPANNWNNSVRAEFKAANWLADGYARLNLSTTFSQNNVSGFETASGGYTLANVGFGGKVVVRKAKFDISLNGNNLFDKKYIAHLSRLKTDEIPNIGRNIILGVNFTL